MDGLWPSGGINPLQGNGSVAALPCSTFGLHDIYTSELTGSCPGRCSTGSECQPLSAVPAPSPAPSPAPGPAPSPAPSPAPAPSSHTLTRRVLPNTCEGVGALGQRTLDPASTGSSELHCAKGAVVGGHNNMYIPPPEAWTLDTDLCI